MNDIQQLILEGAHSGAPMTVEELREYVRHWYTGDVKPSNHSIGNHTGKLVDAGKLNLRDGVITVNSPSMQVVAANPATDTVTIAPYQKQRLGRVVLIEHSPVEIEDVARLEIKTNGFWLPVLMSGNVRVCVGPDIPKWDPAQETLESVSAVRITTKDGRVEEINHNPQSPITLAPAN